MYLHVTSTRCVFVPTIIFLLLAPSFAPSIKMDQVTSSLAPPRSSLKSAVTGSSSDAAGSVTKR